METLDIVLLVLTVVAALFGGTAAKKLKVVAQLIQELGQALGAIQHLVNTTADALKDRKVTKAEAVLLLKSWEDAYTKVVTVYATIRLLLPGLAIRAIFRR